MKEVKFLDSHANSLLFHAVMAPCMSLQKERTRPCVLQNLFCSRRRCLAKFLQRGVRNLSLVMHTERNPNPRELEPSKRKHYRNLLYLFPNKHTQQLNSTSPKDNN